jgi:hypothetical protein
VEEKLVGTTGPIDARPAGTTPRMETINFVFDTVTNLVRENLKSRFPRRPLALQKWPSIPLTKIAASPMTLMSCGEQSGRVEWLETKETV